MFCLDRITGGVGGGGTGCKVVGFLKGEKKPNIATSQDIL